MADARGCAQARGGEVCPLRELPARGSGDPGALAGEELPQDGAVAAGLVRAVAADGEVGVLREDGQQLQRPACVRRLHLGAVAAGEALPAGLARVGLEQADGFLAGRHVREPHVVPVVRRDARLGDAARRAPHRADARPLAGLPGGAETNDPHCHVALPARTAAVAFRDPAQAPTGTPSKNTTSPVSTEYSAPTTSRPSWRIRSSSTREPWRRWSAAARTLARTAWWRNPSGSDASGVSSSCATTERIRSTMEAMLGEPLPPGAASSSRVASMAPHRVWPSTTTSRMPKRSAANSTLPTCDGATTLPATRITNRSPSPWSNTISAGTRASEQPRMIA